MRHFLDLLDWDGDSLSRLLENAARMKKAHFKGKEKPLLKGKVLGMIFEKPSLRTRVSFQAGMAHLGGQSIFLSGMEVGLGKRESLADIARTMSQFVDAVVLRTFQHATVTQFAEYATCPSSTVFLITTIPARQWATSLPSVNYSKITQTAPSSLWATPTTSPALWRLPAEIGTEFRPQCSQRI